MKKTSLLFFFCAVFGGVFAEEICRNPDRAPLRIALYVGEGAEGSGVFRWVELTACMRNASATSVDAAAVRAGTLDGMDVLVVPGGRPEAIAKALGKEGRGKVKSFVAHGGGYIGTSAGCRLAMEPSKGHPGMVNLIPFTFGCQGGKDVADLLVHFNARAGALAGIAKGDRRILFDKGPVPVPSLPVTNAEIEVVATYASDVNASGAGPRTSMAGQAAALAGTYGEGRLFALAVQPELDTADHDILRGAFRYVTGREVEWELPQRRCGQLAVGVACDISFGVGTAGSLQRLVQKGGFDFVPLTAGSVADGALRHLDAVLLPEGMAGTKGTSCLFGDNLERTREFVARGGRLFAWGSRADEARREGVTVKVVADGDAADAALSAFAKEPVPAPPPFPAKVSKPLRAAIYADKGGSNVPVAEMLSLAPEYELKVLDAADYRAGALEGVDLLVQPGGLSKVQYDTLGGEGCAALVRYVTAGGRYFGICAGAFLASQPVPPTERGLSRLGLVPFKADSPDHYRGVAPMKIAITEEGRASLGLSVTNRTMIYWGGPAFVVGDPVPEADVAVWGRYAGRLVNTHSPRPVMEMFGKAALVGGRVGKGRVFLTCPHPEKSEANDDVVKGGIRYLTGVAPSAVNHDRVRGAVSVFFRAAKEKPAAEFYLGTLLRDRRFDVRAGSHLDTDLLRHLDAVVIPAPLKEEDEAMAFLPEFIARGGCVVFVADTEKKRTAAGRVVGAVVVESYDEIPAAILRNVTYTFH